MQHPTPPPRPTEEQINYTLVVWDILLEEKEIEYLIKRGNELWDYVAAKVSEDSSLGPALSGQALYHHFYNDAGCDAEEMHRERYRRGDEKGTLRYEQIRLRDYPETPYDDIDDIADSVEDALSITAQAQAAGLQISVSKVKQALKDHFDGEQVAMDIEDETAVYISATLEYLSAEVLDYAGMSARNFKKDQIDSTDISAGLAMDEDLQTLWTPPDILCGVPECLLLDEAPIRIDVYWRAHDRFPGGNCESLTIRYRLHIQESSLQAEKTEWWNGDGDQSIGSSGPLSQMRCEEMFGKLHPFKEVVKNLILSDKREHVREMGSFYHIWDSKSRDSNAYDTEWTSVEMLVYDDEKSSNPFFKLTRQCRFGPQYGPVSLSRHEEATPEQMAVMDLVHDSVGMGRRVMEYVPDGELPCQERDVVVLHNLANAIPYAVQPQYFA